MIMCVLLCYPVSIHMSQLQATGRPISSCKITSATGYRVYQPGTGYTALVQLTRPQLVTESSDLVHSTLC